MAKKILIADDEQNIVISLEFLMKREGFVVCIAHDGQEALDKARAEVPDLILLDVMMPRKNGYEVCQEIRAEAALQGMTKPFSTKELVTKVKALLDAPA